MPRTARLQQSHLRLVYSADAPSSVAPHAARQVADFNEDLRWELEWSRRNDED
jgi:hypothetical protein